MPLTQEELEERTLQRRAQIAALEAQVPRINVRENDNEPELTAVTTPAQARLNARTDAFGITPLTPKQKALNEELDRVAAVSGREAHYRKHNKTFSGDNIVSGPLSFGLNKLFGGDKKRQASEDILYQGLQKTREAKQLEALRKNQQSIKQADFTANVGLDAVNLANERSVTAATVADDRSVDAAKALAGNQRGLQTQKANIEEYVLGAKSATKHLANAKNLQRFLRTNHKTPQGALAGALTGVRNVMASFGVQSNTLTDAQTGQQALDAILASEMTERGARGLTDKDMDILRGAMPRMDSSSDARREVAEVLLRAAQRQVYGQIDAYDQNIAAGSILTQPDWMPQMRAEYENYKLEQAEKLEEEQLRRALEDDDIARGLGPR
jgi:hypothetical protein